MRTDTFSAPVAAEVRQDQESEAAMFRRAKQVISTSSWQLGEIASNWTKSYGRGRTDEDFGSAVGMSGDQVQKRRAVWDRWGNSALERKFGAVLSWSHFYAALNWDDAESCLEWAYDNQATVSAMKSWREAQRQPADPFGDEDPFGGGDSKDESGSEAEVETGGGPGEEDVKEVDGKDSHEEEQPPRPPRNGREVSGGNSKPPADPVVIQKSKAVKTLESAMRAIDDLHELKPLPNHKELHQSVGRLIENVKSIK